jgi:hypothetical protein
MICLRYGRSSCKQHWKEVREVMKFLHESPAAANWNRVSVQHAVFWEGLALTYTFTESRNSLGSDITCFQR